MGRRGSSFLSSFAWWRVNSAELEKQVAQYASLRFWQSARGLSACLCAFSVLITLLISSSIGMSSDDVALECIIWAVLGAFMYWGQRWAFIVALILWTFEKATSAIGGIGQGATPFVQFIWWTIYMNVFYLGFAVAQRRMRERKIAAVPLSCSVPSSILTTGDGEATSSDPYADGINSPLLAPRASRRERPCPWCAEQVLVQAQYCKHCHRDIPPGYAE